MPERPGKDPSFQTRVQAVQLATKAMTPAKVRAQLKAAIAKLSDTDLKFARGVVINILIIP